MELRSTHTTRAGFLLVVCYAWLAAVSFGLVLLDIIYARLIPAATTTFSEMADFLLLVSASTMLVALSAIGITWHWGTARNWLVTSLAVSCFGLVAPAILTPLLPDN